MSLNRVTAGLVTVLVFSTMIRLVPALYTKMPFSNDVWPLVDLADMISSTGRIPSVDQGGHHVNWPLSVLVSVMYSLASGCDLVSFYQYVGVATISIIITLLCYITVERLVKSKIASLVASLGLALWPSYTLYTSAFLKESFAHSILLLLVYLFSRFTYLRSKWLFLTVLLLYISLIMSHPITSTMFVALMISYVYMSVARCVKWRFCQEQSTLKYLVLASITALALNVFYNVVYTGLRAELELYDLLVLLCYALAVYVSRILLPAKSILLLVLVLTTILGLHLIRIVTAPLNEYILIFIIPAIPVLIATNYDTSKAREPSYYLYLWSYTLPVTTVVLYITTYATHLLGFLHRFLNYLVYTLSFSLVVLTSYGKRYTLFITVTLSVLTAFCMFACITERLPFLYYWTYSTEDLALSRFLHSSLTGDSTVLGDPKFSYMIKSVEPIPFTALANICNMEATLILPAEVFAYGYPITPINYFKFNFNVFTCRSLVYASRRALLLVLQ